MPTGREETAAFWRNLEVRGRSRLSTTTESEVWAVSTGHCPQHSHAVYSSVCMSSWKFHFLISWRTYTTLVYVNSRHLIFFVWYLYMFWPHWGQGMYLSTPLRTTPSSENDSLPIYNSSCSHFQQITKHWANKIMAVYRSFQKDVVESGEIRNAEAIGCM